jgi:hypothetical protein
MFGYEKVRGVSPLDEELSASQEEFCSTELVIY